MGRAMSPEETKERLERLSKDPIVDEMRSKVGYLPIWAMAGASSVFFLMDYAMKTGRVTPGSPRLAKVGMSVLGAFGGLQAGLWKLRSDYFRLDPRGEKMKEMRDLIRDMSAQTAQSGSCPKDSFPRQRQPADHSPLMPEPLVRRNMYGDIIEEDSYDSSK